LSKGKVEKKRSRLESGVEIAVGFSGCPQTLSKIYGSLLSMEVWNNKHFHRSLTLWAGGVEIYRQIGRLQLIYMCSQ